jgi:hypothetical protein
MDTENERKRTIKQAKRRARKAKKKKYNPAEPEPQPIPFDCAKCKQKYTRHPKNIFYLGDQRFCGPCKSEFYNQKKAQPRKPNRRRRKPKPCQQHKPHEGIEKYQPEVSPTRKVCVLHDLNTWDVNNKYHSNKVFKTTFKCERVVTCKGCGVNFCSDCIAELLPKLDPNPRSPLYANQYEAFRLRLKDPKNAPILIDKCTSCAGFQALHDLPKEKFPCPSSMGMGEFVPEGRLIERQDGILYFPSYNVCIPNKEDTWDIHALGQQSHSATAPLHGVISPDTALLFEKSGKGPKLSIAPHFEAIVDDSTADLPMMTGRAEIPFKVKLKVYHEQHDLSRGDNKGFDVSEEMAFHCGLALNSDDDLLAEKEGIDATLVVGKSMDNKAYLLVMRIHPTGVCPGKVMNFEEEVEVLAGELSD